MSNRYITGLDIGTSSIKAVIAEIKKNNQLVSSRNNRLSVRLPDLFVYRCDLLSQLFFCHYSIIFNIFTADEFAISPFVNAISFAFNVLCHFAFDIIATQ